MAATGEESIKLLNQAVEASKDFEQAMAAAVASGQAVLKMTTDANVKPALEKAIKTFQTKLTHSKVLTVWLEAVIADQMALFDKANRDKSSQAIVAWNKVDQQTFNLEDVFIKNLKSLAKYRSARWTAEPLIKEVQEIDNSIKEIIKKPLDSINWEHEEWLEKLLKSEACMKAMKKIHEISDASKEIDAEWATRAEEDEARYKKWVTNYTLIDRCIKAKKNKEDLEFAKKEYQKNYDKQFYVQLCQQCAPWAKTIRNSAAVGFVAAIVNQMVPPPFRPPLPDLNNGNGNIALGASALSVILAHLGDRFCEPYLREDDTLINQDFITSRESLNEINRLVERDNKSLQGVLIGLRYSSEYNKTESKPEPIEKL